MAKTFDRYIPGFVCCLREVAVDWWASDARKGFRLKVLDLLELSPEELKDEVILRQGLIDELLCYQEQLQADQQTYLVAGTIQGTAADFAVYGQLERLVGETGDVEVPASLPELLQDRRLARLWQWHQYMRSKHPIKFKGKRPPAPE